MRGLVISPEYEITNDGGINIVNSDIDAIKLRQYLLYWDKLDFPDNNFISIGGSSEIDYLKDVGVLQRSKHILQSFSSSAGVLYSQIQLETLKNNNEKESGKWSIAQPNSKLILNEESCVLTRNLEVELYESLPVPTSDVSLEDVLFFKERRKDELLEFRHLMDNLYLEILDSGDFERARLKNIDQLQLKIIELDRVMSESRITRLLQNVKIELDYSQVVKNTVGAAVAGNAFGFPVGLSGALGFASSFIKVSSEFSLKPKNIPEGLKDYAYLYYSHKELI